MSPWPCGGCKAFKGHNGELGDWANGCLLLKLKNSSAKQ